MKYSWVVLSVTTVGTLMASLDTNIVVIALPTIARQLPGETVVTVLWTLIGYSLVTATLLLSFGRLADMHGRVRLFTLGFAIFTFGSFLCGFSQTGLELVGFRMVQATGAALLFANSAALVTDAFPPDQRGMALGINQVSIVVGSVSGLVVGGTLTSLVGWRWIFFVNVPIGIFAVFWARWRLKEIAIVDHVQGIDWPGNLSFAGGLTMVLAGVTLYPLQAISTAWFVGLVVAGIASLATFVWVERHVASPMFDLSLFKVRMFAAGNISIFLNALARGAFTFVVVFYLQGPPHDLNALSAGLYLIPVSLSLALTAPASGYLSDRYGARPFATAGLLLTASGFAVLALQTGATTTFWTLFPALVLIGAGFGIYASPNRSSIMNSVPPHRRGVASGMSTTLLTSGNTFSFAFTIAILSAAMPLTTIVAIFTGSGSAASDPTITVGPFLHAIHTVFTLSAILLLVAVIPSALRGKENRRSA
jgi:EmrB/QacA subfamily drug resistance transporter